MTDLAALVLDPTPSGPIDLPRYGERIVSIPVDLYPHPEPFVPSYAPLKRRRSAPIPAGRHAALQPSRGWNLYGDVALVPAGLGRVRDPRGFALAVATGLALLLPLATLYAGFLVGAI